MKTPALLFVLSLDLLPNPTHSTRNPILLPTAAASKTPMLDTDGDELQAGGTYYIYYYIWVYSGVKLVKLDSSTICPSDVIMGRETERPDPIKITPADPTATSVMESTYLNFKFDFPMIKLCVNNVSWEVQYNPESGKDFVKAGDIVSYNFKIEPTSSTSSYFYKITYCPLDVCYNVGLYPDQSVHATRLVLSDYPANVVFMKT